MLQHISIATKSEHRNQYIGNPDDRECIKYVAAVDGKNVEHDRYRPNLHRQK
jgi:hypothetical protein